MYGCGFAVPGQLRDKVIVGIRFISFAASKNMIISSTFFRRKEIHKATYVGTDGVTMAHLDHIPIDKRRASSILSVRSLRGSEPADHFFG